MTPRIPACDVVERQTSKGGALFYVTVEAEFDFISAEDRTKHPCARSARRWTAPTRQLTKPCPPPHKIRRHDGFCIPTEGDNDADAVTHEVAPKSRNRRAFPPLK